MAAETLPTQGTPTTVDNMNVVSLQVPLPKLLDLALGTPEVKTKIKKLLRTHLVIIKKLLQTYSEYNIINIMTLDWSG